jgi:SAM-dependent methyltransferase
MMRGYDETSYGEGFADVYDEWYSGISDIDTTVALLHELAVGAGGGPVLELGVGTGRLALPLTATGLEVHGLDTSAAMLARMTAKPGGHAVHAVQGDMVDDLPLGPFSLVFVAYNTFFNLLTAERQQACMQAVADRLVPGGCFVLEAFVPDPYHDPSSGVAVRSVHVDRVVLSVSTSDPRQQRAEGQYIDITEAGGVRLRPWSIRWCTVTELDTMATMAGFALAERWEDVAKAPFGVASERHVSVWRRPVATSPA